MPENDLQKLIDQLNQTAKALIATDEALDIIQKNDPEIFTMLQTTLQQTGKEIDLVKSKFVELYDLLKRPFVPGSISPQQIQQMFGQVFQVGGIQDITSPGGLSSHQQALLRTIINQVQTQSGLPASPVNFGQNVSLEQLHQTVGAKLLSNTGTTQTKTPGDIASYGLNPQQMLQFTKVIQEYIDALDKLGIKAEKMYTTHELMADGTWKFITAVKDELGVTRDLITVLTEAGNIVDQFAYKQMQADQKLQAKQAAMPKGRPAAQPTFAEEYTSRFGGLPKSVVGEYVQDAGTLVGALAPARDLFNSLGVNMDKVDVRVRKLDDGFLQFTTTMQSNTGLIEEVNAYLSQTGQVLDEVAYKARKAAESTFAYTPEKLAASLGEQRAARALALAQKRGFGVEELKSVETQEPSGISTLKFQARDAEGVIQRLEIVVDRFGKVLTRTNRRLLGFFDSIVRNTGELIKWSVGIGLVYGTYYRFQELMKTAIDNQAKLADTIISLGDAQRDVNDVFDDAAKVAAQTGESINAVLETYTMAYRAVGGIEDPIKRTTAANQLLTDATILNKLSSLEAADSIDVLSGALRQLQGPEESVTEAFQRGTELLDKWVAVTRRANVDLATLATAFSITAESAENAGASMEEINAIIAVISEKIGGLGGRETGNAVRALIGGLYQQQGAELLSRYAISVEDATGKMRPFLDVSRDIYELYQSGIIDETQLNKIGYTLGGGVRRGQQYVAFLSDFARVQEVVNVQTDVQGNAQDALNIKVNTLQTSVTELGNSFQNLAQTMGTEGGALDTMDGFLKTITSLVDFVDRLVEGLGTLTVPAALLAFTSMYFRGDIGAARKGRFGETMGDYAFSAIGGGLQRFAPFDPSRNFIAPGIARGGMNAAVWAGTKVQQYGLGTAIGSLPAIGRAAQGQWGAAGAEIFGAFLGAALTGGSPIGALIGSSMVEAFVSGLEAAKGEISDALVSPYVEALEGGKAGEKGYGKLTDPLERAERRAEIAGDAFLNRTMAQWQAALINRLSFIPGIGRGLGGDIKAGELTDVQIQRYQAEETVRLAEQGKNVPEEILKQAKDFLDALQELEDYTPETVEFEDSTFKLMQDQFRDVFGEYVQGISDAQREELRKNLLAGDISVKEFRTGLETAQGLGSALSRVLIAATGDLDGVLDATEENKDAMDEWADVLSKATPENKQALNSLVSTFVELSRALDEVKDKADGALTEFNGEMVDAIWLTSELGKTMEEVNLLLDNMTAAQEKARIEAIQLPSIFGGFEGVNLDELSMLEQDARQMQEEWFREYAKVTPDVDFSDLEQKAMAAEPIFVYLGTVLGYAVLDGFLGTEFLQKAYDQAIDEGKIVDKQQKVGFQAFDISSGQFFNQIMPQYNAMLQRLEAAGYTPDLTPLVPIFSDGIKDAMSLDWKIVQYLLQQILDTEKKQLDGIYNLPAEGTFWVPQQTLQMARNLGYNEAVEAMGGAGGGLGAFLGGLAPQEEPTVHKGPPEGTRIGEASVRDRLERARRLGRESERLTKEDLSPTEGYLSRIADNTEALRRIDEKNILNYDTRDKTPEAEAEMYKMLDKIDQKNILNYKTPTPEPGETIDVSTGEMRVKDITLLSEVSAIRSLVQTVFGARGTGGAGLFGGDDFGTGVPQTFTIPSAPTDNRPIQTDLNIDINSQIQLVVDGRTLADIVKPYLYHDLIRWEGSAGTVNTAVTV